MKNLTLIALFATVSLMAFMLPAAAADRTCRPSLSNLWKCPDADEGSVSRRPTTDEGATSNDNRRAAARKRSTATDRTCRPSLSNNYKCPRESTPSGATGEDQFSSERTAKAQCGGDTVVWVNTRSGIYHFAGFSNYGTTKFGAYMCEADSIRAGMRAAKNETHP